MKTATGLLVMWLCAGVLLAAPPSREDELKAAIVFNFLKFVEWPGDSSPTVTVGLLGKNPLDGALRAFHGRTLGDRRVAVRPIDSAASGGVHCVYIGPSAAGNVASILKTLGDRSVLTVSDIPRFAEQGGGLGLFREGDRIRFSANLRSLRSSRLKVSSRLLSLARIVDGSPRGWLHPYHALHEPTLVTW
ncbi:MAG: YfiR family protein [Candidatus Eremiobacterota bacterium]